MTSDSTLMRQEILSIPESVARLLKDSDEILEDAGSLLRQKSPTLIASVARGSSDHAATYLKYAIELGAGIPVASIGPSIASIYGVDLNLAHAACIAISQSGQSPDIVAMADSARRNGALTIALTNMINSPLAKASDLAVDILAGQEKSVAATKTYVNSAVAGLAVLAHWTEDAELLKALETLPEKLAEAAKCDWAALKDALEGHSSLFVLGRGPSLAIASEVALKFKETSSVHAEAYSAAEVLHGPSAIVGRNFPVLVLSTGDAAQASLLDAANRLTEQGGAVFVTTDQPTSAKPLPFVRTGHRLTDPLALLVSFYMFVEAFARHRGFNPDQPPHLRKVTETL
ncbi:MAG: SIS domain-containing protein [Phyllobacterium sp.]